MLLNAWLIGRYGQRRTFITVLCIFVAALLVAGAAPNENVLIGCRIVQGGDRGHPPAAFDVHAVPRVSAAPARHRDGLLRHERDPRPRARSHARRHHDRALQLALHLLRRRAGRERSAVLLGSMFMPQREDDARATRFDWPGSSLLALRALVPAHRALERPARRLALRLHLRARRDRGVQRRSRFSRGSSTRRSRS